jgi:hypothetical protein
MALDRNQRRGGTAGHLSGKDRAARRPTRRSPAAEAPSCGRLSTEAERATTDVIARAVRLCGRRHLFEGVRTIVQQRERARMASRHSDQHDDRTLSRLFPEQGSAIQSAVNGRNCS